jgi:hypothetical protein
MTPDTTIYREPEPELRHTTIPAGVTRSTKLGEASSKPHVAASPTARPARSVG